MIPLSVDDIFVLILALQITLSDFLKKNFKVEFETFEREKEFVDPLMSLKCIFKRPKVATVTTW